MKLTFKINRFVTVALTAAVLFFSASSGVMAKKSQQIYIITNNLSEINTLSASDVKRIFKKEKTKIKGKSIIPINAKKTSPLRKAFVNSLFHMSISEEITFWQTQKVRTGLQPPIELSNTVKAVFSIRTGISYCFAKDYKPGTSKILFKI